jgi:hypothetical protein
MESGGEILELMEHVIEEVQDDIPPSFYQSVQDTLHYLYNHDYAYIRIKLKIVITTLQIVSEVPGNLNVQFPSRFKRFLNVLNIANLNLVGMMPMDCAGDYTFIDRLILTTTVPIGLTVLIFLVYQLDVCVEMIILHLKHRNTAARIEMRTNRLKDKYITYFFFLTYLVLPSVSTTIFQMFLCTNVDPGREDHDASDYFLSADMSISCTSGYYYRGLAYALVMMVIYVIGIPSLYLYLLWQVGNSQ